ncbi:uncharacterized protein EDB91DRAFT_1054871 [Suillus paluster]|uniref:uncharacterized protein n=1 Tax=Suillus paluster TaxID=48578 RepID=UPI001B85EA53|nr:uncharacterized protein EDB91DRAFT_1054871 [Suillus paluster]KAG1737850.1 hypothetical protein EDB91DRAFT_1054871 [Suillus paluster]
MSLQFLPYDLLFNIAQDLDIDDVHNLQATCKSLRLFTLTRPVYRQLAHDLLARSRPLPLHAFQRLSDLSTPALIAAVDRARGLEKAWAIRAPRPARPNPYYGNQWYITISVPSHEEIDWLSPITSSYTLCATKSGRVLCWDVRRDICLAEWDPRSLAGSSEGADDEDEDDEEKWELWKCRVEFEERTVYFTMARVLKGYHDDRVMEFMLMRLFFPQELDDYDEINQAQLYSARPVFGTLTSFHTTGVIMNVFLLDPPRRLLSAFVWIASSNTIGLYVLLDWAKEDYVFVDTGVGCLISSNWSCILHEDQIVIHSEEADAAYQHFYPLEVLRTYGRPRCANLWNKLPTICARLTPTRSISKKFVFPVVPGSSGAVNAGTSSSSEPSTNPEPAPQNDEDASSSQSTTPTTPGPQQSTEGAVAPTTSESFTNPYPFPPWYPESAHFVRQWWPTLPGVPRLSCTVVLLAAHDPETHRTRFVLAQHYFKVPIAPETLPIVGKASTSSSSCSTQANDDDMLHLWYVSTPFEVVCVLEEGDDDEDTGDRPRPLVAVDFGHAVWVECAAPVVPPDLDDDHSHPHPRRRVPKCLRFVTFPPVYGRRGRTEEAVVRTLEIPEELDLDVVETINIDQSQGAVILSVSDGKIFILRYE